MAQFVGYFQNDIEYTEGPFVITTEVGFGSGIRLEVEQKGHHCPVLPDGTIMTYLNLHCGFSGCVYLDIPRNRARLIKVAEHLNGEVEKGNIILQGNVWVSKHNV